MDIIILSLLVLTTLYYLWLWISTRRSSANESHNPPLPPGSTGWPIVGETLEFHRTSKLGVPEKFALDRKQKYSSNVFKTSLLREPMVMFCTAEGNKFLFSNESRLVSSWFPKIFDVLASNTFNGPSGAEAAMRMKKIVRPFLKPDSLQKFIGTMDLFTRKHLESYWHGNEVVKVYPLAKKYSFSVVCKLILNLENPSVVSKFEEKIGQVSDGIASLPLNLPGTPLYRAVQAARYARKEIEKLVVERMSSKDSVGHDMMSYLLRETNSGGQPVNVPEIAMNLYAFLVGANDNVGSALSSIIFHMADHPDVYDEVLKEQMEIVNSKGPGDLLNWTDIQNMKYSWNVAREVLRISPPSIGNFREVLTDFTYEGYLIPKGFKVHWNTHATHKNPSYFPNPESFNPSRFEGSGPPPFSFVPFGGGPRMCPANEYVRLKLLVFMHNVVKNFKWDKVFPNEKIVSAGVALAPSKGLPIRIYPHETQY